MSEKTNISWTDCTWNPWRGCRAVSPGCRNCYARTLVNGRMGGDFSKRVRAAKATFRAPLRWNKRPLTCDCGCIQIAQEDNRTSTCPLCGSPFRPRRVFLGSLMDWLDPEVPIEWLADALDIVRRCPDLIFQCVTKRPELFNERWKAAWIYAWEKKNRALGVWLGDWVASGALKLTNNAIAQVPNNVWVIASVEDQKRADERIPHLLSIPAAVRGLSVEPLLERVDLALEDNLEPAEPGPHRKLDWVIVGGESGQNRRDCGVEAIVDVVRQCRSAGVPTYVKQDCAFRPGERGRIPDDVWALKQFPLLTAVTLLGR